MLVPPVIPPTTVILFGVLMLLTDNILFPERPKQPEQEEQQEDESRRGESNS